MQLVSISHQLDILADQLAVILREKPFCERWIAIADSLRQPFSYHVLKVNGIAAGFRFISLAEAEELTAKAELFVFACHLSPRIARDFLNAGASLFLFSPSEEFWFADAIHPLLASAAKTPAAQLLQELQEEGTFFVDYPFPSSNSFLAQQQKSILQNSPPPAFTPDRSWQYYPASSAKEEIELLIGALLESNAEPSEIGVYTFDIEKYLHHWQRIKPFPRYAPPPKLRSPFSLFLSLPEENFSLSAIASCCRHPAVHLGCAKEKIEHILQSLERTSTRSSWKRICQRWMLGFASNRVVDGLSPLLCKVDLHALGLFYSFVENLEKELQRDVLPISQWSVLLYSLADRYLLLDEELHRLLKEFYELGHSSEEWSIARVKCLIDEMNVPQEMGIRSDELLILRPLLEGVYPAKVIALLGASDEEFGVDKSEKSFACLQGILAAKEQLIWICNGKPMFEGIGAGL